MYIEKISQTLKILGIKKHNSACSTGLNWFKVGEKKLQIHSPADNALLGSIGLPTKQDLEKIIDVAAKTFTYWRTQPAPFRGEIIRQIGDSLRKNKEVLATLVSLEMGKIYQEGLGEVQEMIDICDFACGLSRQLYGLNIASERPQHRMIEQWHPLGITAIISAFNFPVAVYSWNAFVAAVCGNVCIWKPSEKTPLTAIAVQNIIAKVLKENELPEGIFNLICGDREIGESMVNDKRITLISATGSTAMGKKVGPAVAQRFGKCILELGGNNAVIVSQNADTEMALRAVVFGAVGTTGQRCTSTRRLILNEKIYDKFVSRLTDIYSQLKAGHPLDENSHFGPLIDNDAVENYLKAQEEVKKAGGKIIIGGEKLSGAKYSSGYYVSPCITEVSKDHPMLQKETFAPLLYIIKYKNLEEAIEIQNNVPQGLSSSIFSLNLRETEKFLSASGSDCGIANVNIGTSGAEIGGAFGGEKETGGGRESGSDAWKAYMRRQTNTINWGENMPLAQGIKFNI